MEAIVKKHSEIMWWSHQTNESSRLRKTLWNLAELQCVVISQMEQWKLREICAHIKTASTELYKTTMEELSLCRLAGCC